MIQPHTLLDVADPSSGARKLMCLRVLGASHRGYARIGDTILAVVREAVPNMPIRKSDKVRAVVVRTRGAIRRGTGVRVRFGDNAAVVLTQEGNPKGTRLFGPVARELRAIRLNKLVSLAPEVL